MATVVTRGDKSTIFNRPNGIVIMYTLSDHLHISLSLDDEFEQFCVELMRYVCSESLRNIPLLILLNINKATEDDYYYDDIEELNTPKKNCKWHDNQHTSALVKEAHDLIRERVKPPQKNWTVQSTCTQCGYNVYESFDWICHLIYLQSN
jgi:hypothetical protein